MRESSFASVGIIKERGIKIMFTVVDNFGEKYGEFETYEEAVDTKLDLLEMELEDDGYIRRNYKVVEVTA